MSKFTKQLDKHYGSHSLEAILTSNLDEPKKEEQPKAPSEKPAEKASSQLSFSAA
jgi:hypothetical protein